MSKKNNKGTKRRVHAADLESERAAAEKRQKLLEKKRTKEALTGVVKVKKSKSVRIRKGVRVKGIKVVDSESKRKVRKLLAAQAIAREMQVDDGPAAKALRRKGVRVGAGKRKPPTAASKSAGGSGKADKPQQPEAMVE